jgi:hypothetical protein
LIDWQVWAIIELTMDYRVSSTFLQKLLLFIVSVLSVGLVGCGGGSSATDINPKVTIDWPAQTRGLQAPTYAGSAIISITPTSATNPITWIVDRPAGTGAQSLSYPGPVVLRTVPAVLNVVFKTGAAGLGTTVATTSIGINIANDGSLLGLDGAPLGTISYSKTLTNLDITATNITAGSTPTTITVNGRKGPDYIALPQDLIDLSITNGSEFATLTGATLTGVAEGKVTIQASFESLTKTQEISVSPALGTYQRYALGAVHIAWDITRSKFWGTFGVDSNYPNSIADIDPTTGAVGTPIEVGSIPNVIAVSVDGTTAYVGLEGGKTIRVVDLATRQATGNIEVGNNSNIAIASIVANPYNASEISVCIVNSSSSTLGGPYIFRNGVKVASTEGSFTTAYTSASEMISVQSGGSGTLIRVAISPPSILSLQTLGVDYRISGEVHLASNSRFILDSGRVYSSTNLNFLGLLAVGTESIRQAVADPSQDLAWVAVAVPDTSAQIIRAFNTSTYTALDSKSIYMPGEYVVELERFNSTGLTVLTNKAMYVFNTAVGLP